MAFFGLLANLPGGLKTYDFKNFLVTVAGQPITSFGDGDGFEIDWPEAGYTVKKGLDGEITRNYGNDLMAHVTLHLAQMADANGILTGLYLFDFDGGRRVNTTTFPVSIVSIVPNGGTYQSNDCWIERPPTVTGAKDAGVIAWPLCCPEMPPLIS